MLLVDSHCHLDNPSLARERPEILARARLAGIGHLVTIGTRLGEAESLIALADSLGPGISCTIGTHPHQAAEEPDWSVEQIAALARHPKVIAIGECGLDYFYDYAPRPVQHQVFRTHLAACRETGLPVVIHARDADDDMIRILQEEASGGRVTGVLHCFSSTRALAEAGLALGFYISLSGIVTFPKSQCLREILRDVPQDRLLVETDAPYLAPVPHRGKRCEPAMVRDTALFVAEFLGLSLEDLAAITTRNFARLFPRADLSQPLAEAGRGG